VAAGITTDSIAQWLGTGRIVRAMPNTPALVGKGMTGLFARADVDRAGCAQVEAVIGTTGSLGGAESHLDAVTALSGSGPAYVFFFLEAMTRAGQDMGLSEAQAYQLAVATFRAPPSWPPARRTAAVLRQRVTSKGGTTFAAITHMQDTQVAAHFVQAMRKAEARAQELAAEFGR
jgi:pyrroline-5-carboxylate reductase